MTALTSMSHRLAGTAIAASLTLTACATPTTDATAGPTPRRSTSTTTTDTSNLTALGRAIDWSSIKHADRVTTGAFVEPKPRAAYSLPLEVQERRVKNRDRVVIPSMNVVASIANSPVVNNHVVVPPGDQVGWVTTTARPGAKRGVTVLAGHLTNGPRGAERGPLWGAEQLPKGSPIRVVWRGKTTTYKVTRVTKHPRNALPPRLFDPNGPNLALITCAGPYVYNASNGQFWLSRNAIIWAEPFP